MTDSSRFKKISFIHTGSSLVPVFDLLASEMLSSIEVSHAVDETLIARTKDAGFVTSDVIGDLRHHAMRASGAGADLIMVTCSSVGPAVDALQASVSVPLLRVDQPMADVAVRMGPRIGVVATLASTLEPTVELIARRGDVSGRIIDLDTRLAVGAFEAAQSGDVAAHDRRVRESCRQLAPSVDVIVLAQASMARATEQLAGDAFDTPVLSSPRLAVKHLAGIVSDR